MPKQMPFAFGDNYVVYEDDILGVTGNDSVLKNDVGFKLSAFLTSSPAK